MVKETGRGQADREMRTVSAEQGAQVEVPCQAEKVGRFAQMAQQTEETRRAEQVELAGQAAKPAEPGVYACDVEDAGTSDLARPQRDQTSPARPGTIEGAPSTEQAGPPVRIAVLVSGGGTNLQALIDAQGTVLTDGEIALVVSNHADAYALTRAARADIPTAVLLRKALGGQAGFEAALTEVLEAHGIEMLVLAGFMTILSAEFTERWPKRILNVHPSLIPKFCGPGFYGLHVHEAVLAAGETVTGATVHYVNEIPDGGEILLQKEVPVEPGDTPETLQRRVMEQAEWILLPQAVESVARRLRAERAEKRDGVEQAER